MFSVSAGSLLMRSVSDEYRGRAQSLYNGGFLVGGVAGPAVGGILSSFSLRAPFFVYSVTLAIPKTPKPQTNDKLNSVIKHAIFLNKI